MTSPSPVVPRPRAEGLLPLAVVGCDFRIASTRWRAAALLDDGARAALLARLQRAAGAAGLVVVETCNRVEWWIDAPDPRWAGDLGRAAMMAAFAEALAEAPLGLPQPYLHVGEDAVRHLLRVVVGLESFVVGEREIAGQLNRAMDAARAIGATSSDLNALQTTLGRMVRAVERGTAFRAHGRGVHAVAVEAVRARLGPGPATVLVAGMGEIGRKTATWAEREQAWRVERINRSPARREGSAAAWLPWAALPEALARADAVIVATGARAPWLTAPLLAAARRERPLLVVDLGAPPQVSADATLERLGAAGAAEASAAGVELLGLDGLLQGQGVVVDDADRARVEAMVEDAVSEHREVLRRRGHGALLRAVWDGYETLTWEEVPAALACAASLPDEERRLVEERLREALRRWARGVVAKV